MSDTVHSVTTILFDIFLAVGFPILCVISWPHPVPLIVFIALILIHIIIAVVRYGYFQEIVWPVWADVVAIYMGVALLLSAIVPRQSLTMSILWSTVGLFIMYGHVRKILFPERPYYFGTLVVKGVRSPVLSLMSKGSNSTRRKK